MHTATVLGEIRKILNAPQEGDSSEEAIRLASAILTLANRETTVQEKRDQLEIHRMMEDPIGKPFTMALTDQGFRTKSQLRAADQIAFLIKEWGVPTFLTRPLRYALYAFRWFGKWFFPFTVPFTRSMIRKKTTSLIILGEEKQVVEHIERRKNEGVKINLNHLGEAILGEEEARRRLNLYLKDLKNPSIEYISVKVSTLYSQISLLNFETTLNVLSERYLHLLHAANANKITNKEGILEAKFVNLDMEEYKDLDLTTVLFKQVLDRPECLKFSAGIVLQAYLPDSFDIQKDLTEWAEKRVSLGGAPIKIRLVKGANLAMEELESSLRGWMRAPYETKEEVDANFKRMLNYAFDHIEAVHIGIGSHNLFDISYALVEARKRGLKKHITFEMLEGMAEPIRRVLAKVWDDLLLYCPTSKEAEFQNAVAYLVRRLDENTAPHNFLRNMFNLEPDSPAFLKEADAFRESVKKQNTVYTNKRRTQDRHQLPEKRPSCRFTNEPDTDLSLEKNRKWAEEIYRSWERKDIEPIPLVIGGEILKGKEEKGIDPSRPGFLFSYGVAEDEAVEKALQTVAETYPSDDLSHVADALREARADLIGAMILNTGKNFSEADVEVSEAIDFAAYYLRQKESFKYLEDIEFKPKGGVLIAPPWNFSVSIPLGGIMGALVTGNNVIFKPAKEAVLPGWVLAQALWKAGVSKKRLQFLLCEDEPYGSRLVSDKRIKTVVLTGSSQTARHLQNIQNGFKLLGETGGKNGIIVSNMSDHDLAIKETIHSAFGYSGQKCSAASLLVLHEELYNDPHFKEQLRDAAASLKVGSAWNRTSKATPLIAEPSPHLLRALTTLEEGEEWLLKPEVDPKNPRLWSPGIKWGVSRGSFTHMTEFFGPVLAVLKYRSLDEAIDIVNETPYGLTSGLFSLDDREIEKWLNKIIAGNLYINRSTTGAVVERQPFGGTKDSSFGTGFKAGGPNYLFPFLEKIDRGGKNSHDAFYKGYFMKKHDPQQVMGQDNFLYYVPHSKIYTWGSKKEAAPIAEVCRLVQVPLEIIEGDEEDFIKALPERARVRLISSPSAHLARELNRKGCAVTVGQVLPNGRIELLNYLREVALSYDYHRYGNLGIRERGRDK